MLADLDRQSDELERLREEAAEAVHRWVEQLRLVTPLLSDIARWTEEHWFDGPSEEQDRLIAFAARLAERGDVPAEALEQLEEVSSAMAPTSRRVCVVDVQNFGVAFRRFQAAIEGALQEEERRRVSVEEAAHTDAGAIEAIRRGNEDFAHIAGRFSEEEYRRRFSSST